MKGNAKMIFPARVCVFLIALLFLPGCRTAFTPYGFSGIDRDGDMRYIWSTDKKKWVAWRSRADDPVFHPALTRQPMTEYNQVSGQEAYR